MPLRGVRVRSDAQRQDAGPAPDAVSKRFTALVRQLGHGYTLYGLRYFMATQLGAVAEAGTVRKPLGTAASP
jgi:hypothetical protein